MYIKYRKFYNRKIKLENPDNEFICCPFVDCEEIIDLTKLTNKDSNVTQGENTQNNMIECNSNHRFCMKCKLKYEHAASECKNVHT